ncbi:MAG: beta-propeller fold lactonase family protein [Phycisphaerae bacterium]
MTAPRAIALVICVLIVRPCTGADPSPQRQRGETGPGNIPFYVGRNVCLECHQRARSHNPCSLKSIPEHDQSYSALIKPAAAHIAALCGVAQEPQQSRVCLGCHATAADVGRRWTADTFDVADGVQCEACHEAGSIHVRLALRGKGTKGRRDEGTKGARWYGRTKGWVREGILAPAVAPAVSAARAEARGSLGLAERVGCAACHAPRPSHREVLDEGYRIPLTDSFYKTPVNLAVSPEGDRLYAVCQHSDSLIVLDPVAGKVLYEISVGKQPHDVAVSPDGQRLYVTNRLADSLTVIDAARRKTIAEVPVGHEPHGVLTDTSGRQIYVLNTGDNSISVIDARKLTEVKRLVAGRGPWSLALHPDSGLVMVTSVRPNLGRFRDPPRSEVTIINSRDGVVVDRVVVAGANMMQGIAFVPGKDVALFTLMRTKNLVPMTRLAQGWVITNGLGIVWPDGRVDQVLLDEPNAYFPDPNDVAVSPDGRYALVSSGGSNRIAVVDVDKLLETIAQSSDDQRKHVLPNHLGMSSRFVVKRIEVGNNPRGIVFSPDGRFAYVANSLDDSVTVIDTGDYTVASKIGLGGPEEITEIRWGERLFHSANITFGQQFSCQSCHPDGHVNGLGFDIEADGIGFGPVDNRTLRGILDTLPFKWEGTNPTLQFQCGPRLAVFFTRLAPFNPAELEALVRYECTIERPSNPYRSPEGLTLSQRRGKAVFERTVDNRSQPIPPESRCITCHNTPYKTSRQRMAVGTTSWIDTPVEVEIADIYDAEEYGELGAYYFEDSGVPQKVLDVPHLINIYDSAPYLHNGSAATLEEIWTRHNLADRHGLARDLTRQQLNDLIAYLKGL